VGPEAKGRKRERAVTRSSPFRKRKKGKVKTRKENSPPDCLGPPGAERGGAREDRARWSIHKGKEKGKRAPLQREKKKIENSGGKMPPTSVTARRKGGEQPLGRSR